ncbi:MAG TPA: hypothetical protein PKE69_08470 [Pyrinomonadaceae bacterium]|nr:hypothetical protein [Pyrinomonadaceae bacterium]
MNYIETVAELFLKRSGKNLLAVSDYVLIAEWEKEEIPLEIVLDSINRIFNEISEVSKNIESIEFIEDRVQINFAESIRQNSDSFEKLKL